MNAAQMREYAKQQAKTMDEKTQAEFDKLVVKMKQELYKNPDATSIEASNISNRLKAYLEHEKYTVSYMPGDPREPGGGSYKISWSF